MTTISEFDYELPQDRIAQTPLPDRSASKLLVDRGTASPEHRRVSDLDQILQAGDLVVMNDTRVLAARLFTRRPTGGGTEVLLLEPDGPGKTAYLLTGNYRVILDYNCSNFYALSVGLLADAVGS